MAQDAAQNTVLVVGADGFIGRHLAVGLRDIGWQVIAHARRTRALRAMGFDTIAMDLNAPEALDPETWRPHLQGVTHVVNTAGVLTASDRVFNAVHQTAPKAIYQALPSAAGGILISAVGIDVADTDFASHRRAGEQVAMDHGIQVLRAGLVLGDTSYGGSSLARALAVLPLRIPVVGDGTQQFNPIHATDLAQAVEHLLVTPADQILDIGGPEVVTQAQMLQSLRGWMGLQAVPVLRLPMGLCDLAGRIGDWMRLGPISRTAVRQLDHGVLADTTSAFAHLPTRPRGFGQFLGARPAGTQDLWHARLYLMRPVLRVVMAVLWLASGVLGLMLPAQDFLPMIAGSGLSDSTLIAMARLGGIADLALGIAILRGYRPVLLLWAQACLVLSYTFAFTFLAPMLWLLPLGGLLKNIPILALILVVGILEKER